MDVAFSDNVVNTIKNLREKVYCSDDFKTLFADGLKLTINATTVTYVPEKFGGWSININTSNEEQTEYDEYVKNISDTLANTISQINESIQCKDLSPNLANVIKTGPCSIVIKI